MPNKKILVTGGAGYIGSHANALLNTLGFQTIVLDNLVYGHKESLHYAPLPFSYNNPFIAPPYSKNIESKTQKTPTAEVSCDDFAGCEAFFARSYLSGSAEAKKANSRKSTQETTQNLDFTQNPKNLQAYILRIASPQKICPHFSMIPCPI